jgi:mpaB/rubber oxygenase-like protein
VTVNPHRALRRIRQLDPASDYLEIYRNLVLVDAPMTLDMGLNMAFYRTYAAPPIARLLASTGELTERTQKRADDTGILVYEMINHGFDHPRGRAALSRMNRIHARFEIAAEDYLYVLAALVVVPVSFFDRYGWRRALAQEKAAAAEFYHQMGRRMNIGPPLPRTYEAFEEHLANYEAKVFAYSDAAHHLMTVSTTFMTQRFPALFARPVEVMTSALMDPPMRAALGAADPPRGVATLVRLGFRTACYLTRWSRPHARNRFADGSVPAVSYPGGYQIEQIGPPPASPRRRGDLDS